MCLGIPGRIVEHVDPANAIAKADVGGVRRNISVQLLEADGLSPEIGDWVLIHVGFAMAAIDEEEAAESFRRLAQLGQVYEDELAELADSDIE